MRFNMTCCYGRGDLTRFYGGWLKIVGFVWRETRRETPSAWWRGVYYGLLGVEVLLLLLSNNR
jgi:hypothetical protein